MANGVTLIAGHNIIMDSTYADEKFARGEITNKQIVTTQKDWDAVADGKVGTLEEQSPVSAWSGVTEQPTERLTDAQVAAEEAARVEAQGYLVDGGVDWGKVENDVTVETVKVMENLAPVALPIVTLDAGRDEKARLFEEFEEFLQWKRSRGKK